MNLAKIPEVICSKRGWEYEFWNHFLPLWHYGRGCKCRAPNKICSHQIVFFVNVACFLPTVYLGDHNRHLATQSGQHSHTSMLDRYNYVFKSLSKGFTFLSVYQVNLEEMYRKSLNLITEQCFLKALANI